MDEKAQILTLEEGGGFHRVAPGGIDPLEATAAIISAIFRLNIQAAPGMPDYKIAGNAKFHGSMNGFVKKSGLPEDIVVWEPFFGPLSNTLIMRIEWSGKTGDGEVGVSHKKKGFLTLVRGDSGLIEMETAREIVNTANQILCGG